MTDARIVHIAVIHHCCEVFSSRDIGVCVRWYVASTAYPANIFLIASINLHVQQLYQET